jgi:hypothetical protein
LPGPGLLMRGRNADSGESLSKDLVPGTRTAGKAYWLEQLATDDDACVRLEGQCLDTPGAQGRDVNPRLVVELADLGA